MTIYVVGTCQTIPLAACLQVMLPDVRVERLPENSDLEMIGPTDVVILQHRCPDTKPRHRGREIRCPLVWFNAFHPDVVYLVGPWGPITPPLGEAGEHSSLVLYGWHHGLSTTQTARLFTEAVFAKLHFFDCWPAAKRALVEEARDLGFAFDAAFARFERSGCFMYSPTRPTITVMAEFARELVPRVGLTPAVEAPESCAEDALLRGPVWAVYPEIGQSLGVAGSYAFKLVHVPGATPTLLDLDEFIARAFEAYAAAPPQSLACPRLKHPAYRDLESVAAGERKRTRNGTRPQEWSRDFVGEVSAAADAFAEMTMEALAPASMRAPLRAVVPAGMRARSVASVTCTVRNDGDAALLSGGRHPVFLCYRWFDACGAVTEVGRSIHTALPGALEPGAHVTIPMRIEAPQNAGRYGLRIALLQSEVAWFDDADPDNGFEAMVDVSANLVRVRGHEPM